MLELIDRPLKFILGSILLCFCQVVLAEVTDPCEKNILAVFRRPTVISSACTTPLGKYTFEGGLQYNEYLHESYGLQLPQAKVRIGLPGRNEVTVIFPNENTSNQTASGLSASQFSVKHNIFYNDHWNTAIRGVFIPASGSKIYGTAHNGYTLNGIIAYRIHSFNLSGMLGYSSYVTSAANGGKRYNTVSPDVSLSWQANEVLQLYAEIYGQLNTAPNKGPGYNTDAGFLFLLTKNLAADIEMGHRLSGSLNNTKVYYGAGLSVLF